MAPKMRPANYPGAPFLVTFLRPFSEGRFWDAFWSPFGSFLASFWLSLALFASLLLPFGSLLLPFGSLLAPFGTLWATFSLQLAHFWCHLAHFCPFGIHFLTFHTSSPHVGLSLYKFARKRNKSILSASFCIGFLCFNTQFRKKKRRNSKAIRYKDKPPFAIVLPRARSGTLPLAT